MCTACVSQGLLYVGGAVGTLRVMAARAEHRRAASRRDDGIEPSDARGGAVTPAGADVVAEPSA